MITTDAPACSEQAVTRARTMLQPRRAIVIDCESTDLPGGTTGNVGVRTCGIAREQVRSSLRHSGVAADLEADGLVSAPFPDPGIGRDWSVSRDQPGPPTPDPRLP